MKLIIGETLDFSLDILKFLKDHFEVEFNDVKKSELKSTLENCDIFWFRLGFKIDDKVISENTRCKIIATPVTGINHIDENICRKNNIKIISLKGEDEFLTEIRATAEFTIGLAMSLMRNIPQSFSSVKMGNWKRDNFRGNELYKKTLGIIGFGRLGKIVSSYANSFGMNIISYEKNYCSTYKEDYDYVEFVENLDLIAKYSDVITVHINYVKANHNFIDINFFKKCKKSAYLINTSRGEVINENDLIYSLKNKIIKGAALDVIHNEHSFDKNSKLLEYVNKNSNLIIAPHIGGNTFESFKKTEMFIANKILDYVNGC